jgi:hypothetical protein
MALSARFQAVRACAGACERENGPRFYDLGCSADCDDLCRGLVAHLLPPLLDTVATLYTADQVHAWLGTALLYSRDNSVYDAVSDAYEEAREMGPRMCVQPQPVLPPAQLPWNRAIRCLQLAFVTEFWTRNAAVLRNVAVPSEEYARHALRQDVPAPPDPYWDATEAYPSTPDTPAPRALPRTVLECLVQEAVPAVRHELAAPGQSGGQDRGPSGGQGQSQGGGKCRVHVTSDTWTAALQRRRVSATVLVEWDMRESADAVGDSVTATSEALRCCTLGAVDSGDGLRAPSSPLDRCAVAGLQPDALVTREVCCTWGGWLNDAPDADNFHPFGPVPVPFDAARFQPPTYDAARPTSWSSAVRRIVRKFFAAAIRRGARVVVLPPFACHAPCGGPCRVLASVYAEAIEETLGQVDEVLVCTGHASFVPVFRTELQDALGADHPRIIWTGDDTRHMRRCKLDGFCTLPWCTDLHLQETQPPALLEL